MVIRNQMKKLKEIGLKKLYSYGIYRRLIWSFVYVFIIPILLIGGFNAMVSFSKNEGEAKAFLESSSEQIANNVSYYLYYHMNLLDEVATNSQIIRDISIYEEVGWQRKSEIENHIRLVLGNTFGASSAINTCELITRHQSYFYYPSPVTNGDFETSKLLSIQAKTVEMTISPKDVPSDRHNYIVLTRGIYNNDESCIGNIVAALDLTFFNKVCYENVTNLLNSVMIIDDGNRIVSASDSTLVGSTFVADKGRFIFSSKIIPDTNLTIVNQIALLTLLRSALTQLALTLFTAVVFAILALFLAILFTESVMRPINRLMEEMNKDEVDKYVEDEGGDEYHTVISGFNKMNGHIVEAIQGQYKSKLQETELRALRKEAELSALQQQINPHFLYNTLESIYWSGQLEGDEEISEIVSALGNYLRAIIDKGREYVTIENEVECINNYIFLQNKRFGQRIMNRWDVPIGIRDTKITKLAIHPIVEDVVATNLNDIEGPIDMTIVIGWTKDKVDVVMKGQAVSYFLGLSHTSSAEMMGIHSVDERLRLYYGDSYGVTLNFVDEEISVQMPVYKGNETGGNLDG